MNQDRTVPADAMRARVEHMLPGKATDPDALLRRTTGSCSRRCRTGSPQRDLPERFGNRNRAFGCFRSRALSRVFNGLSEELDLECVFADGTIVQARRKASGARGDVQAGHRTLERRPDEQDRGGR